jgi:carbon-monoxide dehydrogenase large subunit
MRAERRTRRGAVPRSEDPGLLAGKTAFLEDVPCAGALHAAFVRSQIAHARIPSIDVTAALAMPGVTAVFTSEDLRRFRMPAVENLPDGLRRPLLATDVVRFVGEPIAVVVAATREQAIDAAEAVVVDYDPLPVVTDPRRSRRIDASPLFPEYGSNVALLLRHVSHDDPLEQADVVVRGRFVNQRVAPAPLEVLGALAVPEHEGLTLWLPCQATHYSRSAIAGAIEIDEERIRVRTAAVGGGFGAKIPAYPEQAVVAASALRLEVPVRYVESRSESFVAMTHGRDQLQEVEVGATRDGRLVGLRARVLTDLGAYPDEGATLPSSTALMAVGPYDIPRLDFEIRAVLTNKTPLGAYRGAGRPEATALIERAIDMVAVELGLDPADIRRRNFIREFPATTVTGARYDTGAYGRALDEALRIADYDLLRREQAERRGQDGRSVLGIGIGSYVEVTGWGSEYARVTMADDGSVTVITGSSPQGQGHETAFAQIAAEHLAVTFSSVSVRHSDTAIVPRSEGTMGSRTLQVGGSAVLRATERLVERGRRLAADVLEVAPDDVVLTKEGRFEIVGVSGSGLSWAELAHEAASRGPGYLDVEHDFEIQDSTYPFGTHVAVVEVDLETGFARLVKHFAVDDCGVVLNPMLVEGQVHGGIAQGAAQALFEAVVYDEMGTPLTSNLATYLFPSAADLPGFETANTETPTPLNPLGAKGIGEAGTIGAIPAVQNAVIDALVHLGIRHLDMPTTPERIWSAISKARTASAGTGGDAGPSERPDGRDRDEQGAVSEISPPIREVEHLAGDPGPGGEGGSGREKPSLR